MARLFAFAPMVLLTALLAMLFLRKWGSGSAQSVVGNDDGMVIPVTAAYLRGRFASLQRNTIRPFLSIYPQGIRFRVFSESRWLFSDMDHVDVRSAFSRTELVFTIKGRRRVFIAEVPDRQVAIRVLANLPPTLTLTKRAAVLRDGTASPATPELQPYEGPGR